MQSHLHTLLPRAIHPSSASASRWRRSSPSLTPRRPPLTPRLLLTLTLTRIRILNLGVQIPYRRFRWRSPSAGTLSSIGSERYSACCGVERGVVVCAAWGGGEGVRLVGVLLSEDMRREEGREEGGRREGKEEEKRSGKGGKRGRKGGQEDSAPLRPRCGCFVARGGRATSSRTGGRPSSVFSREEKEKGQSPLLRRARKRRTWL